MEIVLDGSCDKRRILSELSKCLRSVFIEASSSVNNIVFLTIDCSLIQCIDRSLQHGLKNLLHGYWPLVRSCSHTQTLQTIDNWVGLHSSHKTKGHAWLLATLIEGSLQSYLHCILTESQSISRFYAPHAILRDPSLASQLSSLLTGLESINFSLEKSMDFNHGDSPNQGSNAKTSANVRPPLELAFESGRSLSASAMTSSMTSSLASPGDSGFTQLDSETDTASFSEIVLEADSSSMKEEVAVLPVDPCAEKSLKIIRMMEPMTTSDIANANTSSASLVSKPHDLDDVDSDDIVYRKPKTTIGKQQKRVSFHECTLEVPPDNQHFDEQSTSKEIERLSNSLKSSASNLSRAVGDLSAFKYEQEGVEIGKDSILLGNDGIQEISAKRMFEVPSSLRPSSKSLNPICSVKSFLLGPPNLDNGDNVPVTERGIPEGQEDPPHNCPNYIDKKSSSIPDCFSVSVCDQSRILNSCSSVPSCASVKPQVSTPGRVLSGPSGPNTSSTRLSSSCVSNVLTQTPSKACLVKRFLRSITEKKISNCRSAAALAAGNKKKSSMRSLNLYIQGVKPSHDLSQEILDEIREEMDQAHFEPPSFHTSQFVMSITSSWKSALHCLLELSDDEQVIKILKVRDTAVDFSGRRIPILAVVTNQSVTVVDCKIMKHSVLLHAQLSSVLVGANSQWISMINTVKSSQLNFLIGESFCVSELISCIELTLRRESNKLPSVIHLSYEDLYKIPYWKPILQGEKVYHYSIVHAVEETLSPSSSPPNMKGYFMFRKCENNVCLPWEPGYFVLKADKLYIFSDEEEAYVHFQISLNGVECCYIAVTSRPHTIKVGFFHVAAPDDSVAHNWLVALKKASTEVYNEKTDLDPKLNVLSGSLLLTESRLMLINSLGIPTKYIEKTGKLLLTAFVSDVTALRVSDSDSSWCIVEFSCREVHESGGDYIIFFSTRFEMLAFRDNLWELSPSLVQSTTVLSHTEPLRQRCNDISTNLLSGWDLVIPTQL